MLALIRTMMIVENADKIADGDVKGGWTWGWGRDCWKDRTATNSHHWQVFFNTQTGFLEAKRKRKPLAAVEKGLQPKRKWYLLSCDQRSGLRSQLERTFCPRPTWRGGFLVILTSPLKRSYFLGFWEAASGIHLQPALSSLPLFSWFDEHNNNHSLQIITILCQTITKVH